MSRAVLIVTDVTAPGGVDTYTTQLYRAVVPAGWRAAVLMDQLPGSDLLHRALLDLGAPVMRGPLYHRSFTEQERAAATRDAIARFAPAVVHAVCGAPWTTIVPREVALAEGLPLHFTEQYVAPGFTFAPELHARIVALYRRARTVIAVSRNNAELLTATYGFPGERVIVIPNSTSSFDLAPAPNITLPAPERRFHAVTVARLHEQKGIDVLLAAIARLPDADRASLHFSLIGDGPAREPLERQAAALGVLADVAFLGWRDNAASLLPAFDLFVLPSRAEGQPFALVEAAAAGLPIIAADASGIAEVLDDGRGGTLVTPGDPEALAAELAEFVADPAPFRARARHGQAQARDRYDAEANLRRTIARWDD